jgi:hypothetical protein
MNQILWVTQVICLLWARIMNTFYALSSINMQLWSDVQLPFVQRHHGANITEAKRFRRQLERRWRSSKSLSDRAAFVNQCKVINNLFNESKQLYYNDLSEENSSNSKLLFKLVNKLLQKNTDRQYPKEHDDKSPANSFPDYCATKI